MDETTTTGEQLMFRPTEAAQRLGLGRTKVYELMASGELRSVKIGAPDVFRHLRSWTSWPGPTLPERGWPVVWWPRAWT